MVSDCPICGYDIKTKHGDFEFTPPENIPGGVIVLPDSTWEECENCREQILSPSLITKLDEIRYQRLGLLTPAEITNIRKEVGLTQVEISKVLGFGEKTYTRWETGKSIQNKSNDNLIRLFAKDSSVLLEVDAQRSPERKDRISNYFESLVQTKGGDSLAMAAHDSESRIDEETAKLLQKRIKELIAQRENGE